MSPNLATQVSAHRILVGLWEHGQKRAFSSGISLQPSPKQRVQCVYTKQSLKASCLLPLVIVAELQCLRLAPKKAMASTSSMAVGILSSCPFLCAALNILPDIAPSYSSESRASTSPVAPPTYGLRCPRLPWDWLWRGEKMPELEFDVQGCGVKMPVTKSFFWKNRKQC